MDDLRPLQSSACGLPEHAFALAPRVTYQYNLHSDDEGTYTDWAAQNPAYGVAIPYYLPKAAKTAPVIRIYDAQGHIIRTVSGNKSNPYRGKDEPWIKNEAGLQQFVWDMTEDGPEKWNGAGKFFKGPNEGASVPPGRYTLSMAIDGRTFTHPFVVKADPETNFTQAELVASYKFSKHFYNRLSELDAGLNRLDDVKNDLDKARKAAVAKNDTEAVTQIDAALANRQKLQDSLTANYQNGEDFIQRPGKLREDLMGIAGVGLVTPAVEEVAGRIDRSYVAAVSQFNTYIATLPQLNSALKSGSYGTVTVPKPLR